MDGRVGSLGRSVALLALAAGFGSSAAGTASAARASTAVLAGHVDRAPAAVRAYWTARRMARAEPAELAVTPAGRVAGREPAGRRATDTSAASSSLPARLHGKVFLTIAGGSDPGDFVCSGTAVHSSSHTVVLTAGHCVNDAQFGGGFATNWIFVPGYRNGEEPYGEWPATQLLTTAPWADTQDIRQDLGAARVVRDGQGRGIEDVVGARPIEFKRSRAQQYTAFGYPAEPTLFNPTFDGQRLFACGSGVTGSDSPPGDGPQTLQIDCDMSGGSSGGGWVNADGAVNGLTSYGYTGDFVHLFGPYFGAEAKAFYEKASGPPLRCHGAEVTNLGTGGPDDFAGGEGAEVFRLAGSADRARGGGGEDFACGGADADRLKGGEGDDTLVGGPGPDVLNGGPGMDLCIGGPGRDRGPGCERKRRIP